MPYQVLERGAHDVVALISVNDDFTTSCPALEFLKECYSNKNYQSSCKGYRALFSRYAEQGYRVFTSALSHEVNKENAILELIKGDLRLLYFMEHGTIFLTNGYIKKSQGADPSEVTKAIRAKNNYLAQAQQGRKK